MLWAAIATLQKQNRLFEQSGVGMRGLVSFCLFGDDPSDIYYKGAVKNAQQYSEWHPDWDLWFYIGKTVPERVLERIQDVNPRVRFEMMDEPENQTSTYWRINAVFHSDHDFIIFRDVDSRPCHREKVAVEEWLRSDYPYHAMRDHQYHGRQLLAGLWGLKQSVFHELRSVPKEVGQNEDWYGVDQVALLLHVWPLCRRKILAHIGCYNIYERMEQRRPFTAPRDKDSFVGQGFMGDETIRYPGHEEFVVSDYELRMRNDIFMEEYRVSGALQT